MGLRKPSLPRVGAQALADSPLRPLVGRVASCGPLRHTKRRDPEGVARFQRACPRGMPDVLSFDEADDTERLINERTTGLGEQPAQIEAHFDRLIGAGVRSQV